MESNKQQHEFIRGLVTQIIETVIETDDDRLKSTLGLSNIT